jgi:ketosteroid isomerase-like protein
MSDQTATVTASELAAENREHAEAILRLLGSEEQFRYFHEDIVMEFPYASSIGQPERHEGIEDVLAYTRQLNQKLAGLRMRDWTLHSVEGDPATVFIEYEGDAPTPGGNSYVQTYVNKMQFRDGKLIHMREFWDPKRIIDANSGVLDAQLTD